MFEITGLTGVIQTEAESKNSEVSEPMRIPVGMEKGQVLKEVRGKHLWSDRYMSVKGRRTKKGKVKGEKEEK